MQIALQQELEMPDWRRTATFFTAFVEGWGLYSERLGIEMGLYDTPQKDMGRLGYEMWRATRLVVDTGIHAKGWTKEQAVAFMTDNTTLTDANIDAEVNRYIANPGQALAYKLGELKIRELRARAEKALGDKFDLRRFHDAVLGRGAVPLDTLEAQINDRGGKAVDSRGDSFPPHHRAPLPFYPLVVLRFARLLPLPPSPPYRVPQPTRWHSCVRFAPAWPQPAMLGRG